METNKRPLMKHFSAVLRKRALSTVELNDPIHPRILKFFTRKELIQILKDKNNGTIPKEHNLSELENEELLVLIQDDMYIISYMTQKWCLDGGDGGGGESPQISNITAVATKQKSVSATPKKPKK